MAKLLGLLEIGAGQPAMAVLLLDLSLSLQADFGTTMHLADILLQLGEYAQAKANLTTALALQPDTLEAQHKPAITLDHLGEFESALALQLP